MNKKLISFSLVFILALFAHSPLPCGLPEGENVVSGSADFDRSAVDTLDVNTPSERLIVDYNSFSIAQQETVNFYQPSASAIALNRVVGIAPSDIFGALNANGRIYVVNPNGVLFGPESRVDVAALVASTLDISNVDFLAGQYNFNKVEGKAGSYIFNQGYIGADSVALLASAVSNEGTIEAGLGSVVLATGEALTLNLDTAGMISVVVDEAVQEEVLGPDGEKISSAIDNSGEIIVGSGTVSLSANALDDIFDYAVNNSGVIEAGSLENSNGEVVLKSNQDIRSTGKISALGGLIQICADKGLEVGGIYEASRIIFGPEWLGQVAALVLSGDTVFWSSGDIDVSYDITHTTGDLKFYADAIDEDGTRDDWDGNFKLEPMFGSTATISTNGNLLISGVRVEIYEDGALQADGNIDLLARNEDGSAYIEVHGPITSTNGDISLISTAINEDTDCYSEINVYSPIIANGSDITLRATNTVSYTFDSDDEDYDNSSENYAAVAVSGVEISSDTGNVTLEALNTVTHTVTTLDDNCNYNDSSQNYAEIIVGEGFISTTGDINLTATNRVTRNITGYYVGDFYEYSTNYAQIELANTTLDTTGEDSEGTISLTATNDVDSTVAISDELYGDYDDQSYNYARIYINCPDTIETDIGEVTLTADNTVTRDLDIYYVYYYFYDYSANYAYLEIEETPIYSSDGNVILEANNTVFNTLLVEDEEYGIYYDYDDESLNYAYLYIYGDSTIETDTGDITLSLINSMERDLDIGFIDDYFYNYYTENYAHLEVGNTPISSDTGIITLEADNTLTDTIVIDNYVEDYDDTSSNYAAVYVYNEEAATISTTADIIITADNTVTRDLNIYYTDGYFYDYSENYAYVELANTTLDTTGEDSEGTISLTATNNVTSIVDAGDYLDEYYDESEVYAYIYANSPNGIKTDTGAIDITANNTFTRDVSAEYIYYIYDETEYTFAELDIYNTPIYSTSGNITLDATNTVDTTVTAVDPDGLGEGGIDWYGHGYDNYDYNISTVNVGGGATLSTIGDISLASTNTVETTIIADKFDTYYYENYSENYAQIDLYATLDTRSGDGNSIGTVTLDATNDVTTTVTIDDYNGIYDESYNYAYISTNNPSNIYTDTGAVSITADNTFTGDISGGLVYIDYFTWYNYADLDIYNTPIYSTSGNITLAANNTTSHTITAVDPVGGSGVLDYYYDDSYNFSEVYVSSSGTTLSTTGDINLTSTNTVTRNADADSFGDYDYDNWTSNYAKIYVYGALDTTADGTSTGSITIDATNDVTVTVTVDGNLYYDDYNDYSSNDADIYIYETVSTDNGDISITTDNFEFGDELSWPLIVTSSGDITFALSTPDVAIAIGHNTPDPDDWEIDEDSDLFEAASTSSGTFFIGSDTAGPVTVGTFDFTGFSNGNFGLISGDSITDLEGAETIIANDLTLYAAGAIGTSDNALDTEVATLTAQAGGSIYIDEVDDLTVDTIETTGDVELTAGGWIRDIADTIIADTLTLTASTGIGTSENALDTEVATLTARTTADGADIYIDEADDLIVDTVTAGTAAERGDVELTVGGGLSDLEGAETITAAILTLDVEDGIGTSDNALDTEVATLTAQAGGSIYINEADGIGIAGLTAGGSATVTANGSSTLSAIVTAGNFDFTTSTGAIMVLSTAIESLTSGVNLTTLGGSILAIGSGPHLIAADDSTLTASGVIASFAAPFDVLLTGADLTVSVSDEIAGVSGVFSGVTLSDTVILDIDPPGTVSFNDVQIWPELGGDVSGQAANALVFQLLLPSLEQLALYQTGGLAPGSPVYFYQSLTEIDLSLFDELELDEEDYSFLEETIGIIGHEGLLPLP